MSATQQLTKEMERVTLADKRVEVQTYDRYKGRKGVTDRLALISPTLVRVTTHFIETKKRRYRCITTPTKKGVCCQHVGAPDQNFGLVLFQYTTDELGSLLTEEKLSGRLKLWVISESRYAELSTIHKEYPLIGTDFAAPMVDLTVKCSEENFQRMNFTPCKEAFWKRKKEWFDKVMDLEDKARSKLTKALGQELTELEFLQALGIDSGTPGTAPTIASSTIEVSDILGDV